MLAIVASLEHCRLYMAERRFKIKTDKLTLVSILKNAGAKLSARLDGMNLRLQHHCFQVMHNLGEDNPTDYFSRHSFGGSSAIGQETKGVQDYNAFICTAAIPDAMTHR